ncbi:glucose 1-dehydrogenase [Aquimarina sp. ERC-38]|uniref:glucose 1-dehydrogenase n=1 Tax=Aquimarina sp. ERC-38 TaxID=2949996 RepID=UPI0022480841|nr:glucose 1-dehydrogenase [Aquimarina sp. ERC-38]UZO80094.1 glucose 1-dehydrogenase [Aquimarina sp. ERC-38]
MKTMERPGLQAEMEQQPETIKDSYKGSGKLEGKTALITGGDSGIGRAVAVHFAREGANVAIAYLNEEQDAQKTKELVEKEGGKCVTFSGNLTDKEVCQHLIDQTMSEFGQLDILINNAATQYPNKDITNIDYDELKETFDLNIVSMIYLTKLALEHMKEGSRIINTTSVTGYKGHEMMVDYSSTKGAITSFTRALSAQLAEKKILVNGVAPGPIMTPLIPATMGAIEDFGKQVPLGRPGQPSELAPAYVYLASEDSTYVTGQIIHVNGGTVVGG